MLNLILAVVLGLVFAFVALQNSAPVDVQFGAYLWQNVPLFLVASFSFLLGIIAASLFSLAGRTSSTLALATQRPRSSKGSSHH